MLMFGLHNNTHTYTHKRTHAHTHALSIGKHCQLLRAIFLSARGGFEVVAFE